jgi:hypothetical protein
MKMTKRRVVVRIVIDPAANTGLESVSATLGMKPEVLANRVLEWVMSQDSQIREMILQSDSIERDADLSKLILRKIANRELR